MTTIVYRSGILAADSRAYSGGREPMGDKVKVHTLGNGLGYAGVSSSIPGGAERVIAWLNAEQPEDFDLPEKFTALMLDQDGKVYYACDTRYMSGPLTGDFFAIGSGNEYAIGAMKRGASAIEAVKVAIDCDVWSGPPINAIDTKTGKSWEERW